MPPREAGGVLGAVEKTAERTYGQLSPTEQATLRQLLTMRLSTCQEGVGFVRRRATLEELQPADPAQARIVERIIGVTHPGNRASQHVLTKIGMADEGWGRYYDRRLRLFAILGSEL